jgi:zinc protease
MKTFHKNTPFRFYKKFVSEPEEYHLTGFQLENGLQVIMLKNHQVPVVAVDLWYKVGSKDEEPGKSGFAHLFEHMMFEGSENVGKAEHIKLLTDVGGTVNGSTTQDRTNYWQVVPANQLELALWLEADRLRSLKINRENFENQRATVKEERRLRIDNQPYMPVIYELKDQIAYQNYAYQHSVMGSMEDLDRATLEDVTAFHNLYYRPNNAVMAVVGDFSVQQAFQLVKKYFSKIPAGAALPPVDLSETPHQQEVRFTFSDPFAPFPALLISQLIPERIHPAFYPLELLEKILFDGESARFYRTLVEEKQLALHAVGGQDGKFGPALFFLFAQLHPQKKLADLEKAIYEEFEKIQSEGVREEELEKAKNKVRADFVSQQETARSLADNLCMYTTVYQQPQRIFSEIELFARVTPAEVQAAAKEYLSPARRSIIEVIPQQQTD